MTPARRALTLAAAGTLALALGGCFEEAVREDLELRFEGDAAAPRVAIDLGVTLMHAGGVPEEERGDRDGLLPLERYRVESVEEAMAATWEILEIAAREAYSINEISRLAYDPFPARIRIVPGGPVVATEGFEEDEGGGYRVPTISLWDALRELDGEWLAPDPLLMLTHQGGEELGLGGGATGETPTLASVLAVERFHPPAPAATEIRNRLESRLAPRPYYRVVWTLSR